MNTEHHYFASTPFNWATGATPEEAIARVAEDVGSGTIGRQVKQLGGLACYICKVHAPQDAGYGINFFQPVGVETSGGCTVKIINTKGHCFPTCE